MTGLAVQQRVTWIVSMETNRPISEIVFNPWIGPRFGQDRVRMILLGESFYGEPDEIPAQSGATVIDKWQSGEWNIRYLVTAARLLTGKKRKEVDRHNDLAGIVFYNFVQTMMDKPGHRPTSDQMFLSRAAFHEVLRNLNPTHVLATGRELWNNMPEFDGREAKLTLGGKNMEVGEYRAGDGFCIATNIPHLSRFFSPDEWKPTVDEFLALDKLP